jgi:hypothetical protein
MNPFQDKIRRTFKSGGTITLFVIAFLLLAYFRMAENLIMILKKILPGGKKILRPPLILRFLKPIAFINRK